MNLPLPSFQKCALFACAAGAGQTSGSGAEIEKGAMPADLTSSVDGFHSEDVERSGGVAVVDAGPVGSDRNALRGGVR